MQYVCTIVLKINRLLDHLVSKRQKTPNCVYTRGYHSAADDFCNCEKAKLVQDSSAAPPLAAVLAHPATGVPSASTHIDAGLLALLLRLLRVHNPFLDIARKTEERLLNIDVALRTDFHERDTQLVC